MNEQYVRDRWQQLYCSARALGLHVEPLSPQASPEDVFERAKWLAIRIVETQTRLREREVRL